jgi:hypothetical protein
MPPRQESGVQHWEELLQGLPSGRHGGLCLANDLFGSPKQASAIPARLMPNLFSAWRRVTDCANPLASSSNLSFIGPSFVLLIVGFQTLLQELG